MTKLKVLEINKQLKTSADATLSKYNQLLKNAQESISVVKKLEAEVIKHVKAQAEENRIKKEQEKRQENIQAEKAKVDAQSKVTKEAKPEPVKAEAKGEQKPAAEQPKEKTEAKPAESKTAKAQQDDKPVAEKTVVKAVAKETKSSVAKSEPIKKAANTQDSKPRPAAGAKTQIRRFDNKNTGQTGNRPANPNYKGNKNQTGNRPANPNYKGNNNQTGNRPANPNYKGNNNQTTNRPTGNYNNQRTGNQTGNRPAGGGYAAKPAGGAAKTVTRTFSQPNRGPQKGGYNNNRPGGNAKSPYSANKFGKKNKRSFNRHNIDIYQDDQKMRGPRKIKKQKEYIVIETKVVENAIITTEEVSVKVLAEKTGKPVADILKKLLLLGLMCTINTEIDFDTAQLICTDFNITLEHKIGKTAEDVLDDEDKSDDDGDLAKRPPVVTIMGHVDHGKTSLLDAIRETKVTEGEAGGITQHIGAYTVKYGDEPITFLDTPGHEAFTSMRARGAQVTDIAILVVAADDGVMPQTIEAINHAKDAGVPIIVAINKIDRPAANVEKIKQELTEHNLIAEEWGGDTIMTPVSAITKEGVEKLLEMILLVSEMLELKANPDRLAKGTIIEARLDKGRGPVATVLVTNGTLNVQDAIVAGTTQGRIRAMVNDDGVAIMSAGPSVPVEVVGFSEVPAAGDMLNAVDQDKLSRKVVEERKNKLKADRLKNMSKVSLEDLFDKIAEGQLKNLNIVVKADVQGSAEAIRQALEKIESDEVKVNVKQASVGAIAEADVMLAAVSNAIVIGFNVRPDNKARIAAQRENVDMRLYRVIYDAIEDIENALVGMLDPEFKEEVVGHVEIRELFKVSAVGTIGGCYVTDGKVNRNAQLRLIRDNIVIHEGEIGTLRRFKDDVKEVQTGFECGISINKYNDIKVGDVIEAFEMKAVERKKQKDNGKVDGRK
jgi:translation initiation factor IF-2